MRNIMVDIETLSTEANAVVLGIGAVLFDPHGDQYEYTPGSAKANALLDNPEYGGTLPYDIFPMCFERTIDIQSCLDVGMAVSGGTLKWWSEQADEARKPAFAGEDNLREVINDFTDFVKLAAAGWPKDVTNVANHEDVCVWGHGPAFDNAILRNVFHRLGYQVPWSFRNDRCNRTFLALAEEKLGALPAQVRVGTFHNGLDDAITQAMQMQRVNAALRQREVLLQAPVANLEAA